jgi:DnaJ family protein A protein 2
LGDPEKRKTYDRYGLAGLEGQGGEGHSADDIFSMFFGGGGGRARRTGPQKGEDIVHEIKANLQDLYNGKTSRLAINRNKLCQDCEGRGGKVGAERNCGDCNGRGVRVQLRQIGPGMVQQIQSGCSACQGTGKIMDERDKCKSCKGKKTYKDRKVLEVVIEKGMKNGQKIKFAGEADELPGTIPGDVVFVIKEVENEVFKRKGADLVTTINIELSEALCGFTKTITHMDGRVLKIDSPPGKVIKPDSVHMIQGEGMPYHGNPFTKGRLFLLFRVNFPNTLSRKTVDTLKNSLPPGSEAMLTGNEEDHEFTPIDMKEFGQGNERMHHHQEAHDEDDEDGRGGGAQRVQCQNCIS